jgi:hypothetical protein
MTAAKEVSKYKLDLAGIQEVKWDRKCMAICMKAIYTVLLNLV